VLVQPIQSVAAMKAAQAVARRTPLSDAFEASTNDQRLQQPVGRRWRDAEGGYDVAIRDLAAPIGEVAHAVGGGGHEAIMPKSSHIVEAIIVESPQDNVGPPRHCPRRTGRFPTDDAGAAGRRTRVLQLG
jgi:hypothetical protein